jgi:hypothetical protein
MRNHPDFTGEAFSVPPAARQQFTLYESTDQLDLKRELALVYSNAQALFDSIASDYATPANQKAQTLSTILNILKEVLKDKETLYNVTEVAEIETALGKTLQEFPDIRDSFMQVYKGHLNL